MITKPLSNSEIRILIYNRVKRGLSYEQAKKEVEKEIKTLISNHEKIKK